MAGWKKLNVKNRLPSPWCYGIAFLTVGVATVVRLFLDPYVGDSVPFAPYFLAIAVTLWFTRTGPCLFAIALSVLESTWFFIPPRHSFLLDPAHSAAMGLFVVASLIFVVMAQAMRKAKAGAEAKVQTARQQQKELEALLEAVPVAIWRAHDPACHHMVGNQETHKLLKLPQGANVSKTAPEREASEHYDFYQKGRLASADQLPIQTAARSGQPLWGQELELRFTDGTRRWIYGNAVPLRNDQGVVWGAVGAFMEITDRKEMELRLATAQAQLKQHAQALEKRVTERTAKLQELVGELEHFSYSITHDMRAPLRAMSGFTQMMLAGSCKECVHLLEKEHLQRVMKAAQRLDRLILDALNYARVVRSALPLEPVNVASLLRDMIETYPNLQPSQADIRLERAFPLVLGNVAALTECFSNLLGNAVKFVAPGTFPRIRIWAEPRNGSVRLWFKDNGIGIPRGRETRIFDMFQRLAQGYEGTGIGLAIVRKAAERMGGKVGVESEEGQGSRFWLELKAG